jgi:hypothetical protein
LIGGQLQLAGGPPVSCIEMNTTLIAQFHRVDFGLGEAYRREKSFLKTRVPGALFIVASRLRC